MNKQSIKQLYNELCIKNKVGAGSLNPKALIMLLVAVVIFGGLATSIFSVNSTTLTASGAPSWAVTTIPIVIAAVIVMWFVKGIGGK